MSPCLYDQRDLARRESLHVYEQRALDTGEHLSISLCQRPGKARISPYLYAKDWQGEDLFISLCQRPDKARIMGYLYARCLARRGLWHISLPGDMDLDLRWSLHIFMPETWQNDDLHISMVSKPDHWRGSPHLSTVNKPNRWWGSFDFSITRRPSSTRISPYLYARRPVVRGSWQYLYARDLAMRGSPHVSTVSMELNASEDLYISLRSVRLNVGEDLYISIRPVRLNAGEDLYISLRSVRLNVGDYGQ